CVSIGLVRVTPSGTEPLVGVVAAPALGLTWSGARGLGALRNDEPCRVTSTATLQDSLVATGFAYDQSTDDDNVPETRAFLKRTRGIRRCGAAAIDLAMTADGTYDLYWEQRLNPWDISAGALLVLEAGGRLSDYGGGPLDVRKGRVVASNGAIHDEALGVLTDVRG
ncbi:inositol monophosphatase, partial [Myxococcota bacterium]|nr:inositol monophosphatase [Myxococcota bacterium]